MALNNAQERYTDSRRTRVYQREQEQFIGQTQAIAPKEKLLEGLSIPQVIAGAAAAATSVALASHIGIAGSVIGAAVSSIVTVLSSQVYRHFLSAGAAKLKHEPDRPGPSSAYVSGYGYSERAAQGYYDRQPARYGARIAPTKLQARAAAERAATQRKVVMFSVGTAVLAVALSVAIILALTEGKGLGERVPAPWSAAEPAQEQSDKTPETSQADAARVDQPRRRSKQRRHPPAPPPRVAPVKTKTRLPQPGTVEPHQTVPPTPRHPAPIRETTSETPNPHLETQLKVTPIRLVAAPSHDRHSKAPSCRRFESIGWVVLHNLQTDSG